LIGAKVVVELLDVWDVKQCRICRRGTYAFRHYRALNPASTGRVTPGDVLCVIAYEPKDCVADACRLKHRDETPCRAAAIPASATTMSVGPVCDDGIGGANPAGSGITGQRDRVEALGGTFRVDSAQGQGTIGIWQLPTAVPLQPFW
jgi:hypothetical protein